MCKNKAIKDSFRAAREPAKPQGIERTWLPLMCILVILQAELLKFPKLGSNSALRGTSLASRTRLLVPYVQSCDSSRRRRSWHLLHPACPTKSQPIGEVDGNFEESHVRNASTDKTSLLRSSVSMIYPKPSPFQFSSILPPIHDTDPRPLLFFDC